jgi:hypothetical protein
MVSSYLLRPIRTLEQAQQDCARIHRRSTVAPASLAVTMLATNSMVRVLRGLVADRNLVWHGTPPSPADREAA